MSSELEAELKVTYRNSVFETLRLIASKDEQLEYQKRVPIAAVSGELFNLWESFYQEVRHADWFIDAFSQNEMAILVEFDYILEQVSANTPTFPPFIEEFVHSEEWRMLAEGAQTALKKLEALK